MANRGAPWIALALLISVSAAAADVQLTAAEQAYIAQKGPLTMCVAPDWPPMESIDAQGRHVGIGAEFIALMAERGGLEVQLVPTRDWAQTYAAAESRHCDFLSMIMSSPERAELFDFTTPYVEIPGVIVTRQDVPYIASIDQVLDRPLGIVRGFAGAELLRGEHPDIQLVVVENYQQGLGRVQAVELFGMLGNMASIGYLFQQNQISDLKIAGWVGSRSRMSVGTRKDEPMLGQVFQKLVDAIEPEESQAILNHWLNARFEQGFDYAFFWRALILLLLGIALVTVWALRINRLNRQLREANERLAEAGRRDALTGLHNRLYLDQKLAQCVRTCSRNELLLTLAMIDIDHFKQINDHYGHPFGDAALKQLSTILQTLFRRESDSTVRYGGEEFVVMIEGGKRDEVLAQLENLRQTVARTPVVYDGRQTGIKVSIGVYSHLPPATADAMSVLKAADAALYRAKEAGRNRVEVAP